MEAADEIIHQQMRLRIMATLNGIPDGAPLEFTRLRAILSATDGNLGAHLATLETAGYVTVRKDFVGRKPRTRVAMTAAGRRAFERHLAFLRDILDAAG